MTTNNDHLAHYGTKGMKWGQRKSIRAEKKQAKADRYDDIMRSRSEVTNKSSETNKKILKARDSLVSATTDRGRQSATAALIQAETIKAEHHKNGTQWARGNEIAALVLFGVPGAVIQQDINLSRWEKSQGR